MGRYLIQICMLLAVQCVWGQNFGRRLGQFTEVFAWKQLTYNLNGNEFLRQGDDSDGGSEGDRSRRQAGDNVVFNNEEQEPDRDWNQMSASSHRPRHRPSGRPTSTSTNRPTDESRTRFIQYNNVPMGVEKVGNRLFITVPRRRYGIPSTLNYIDLSRNSNRRSPALNPYPSAQEASSLTSVYRTRADQCGRLWMVDTGLMEIPNNPQQVQPPAIVVFDLNTNRQIFRYPFKSTDIPAANTPTGLASITVEIISGDCSNAYAYVPDLTTFGIIVYSLRDNDSWRHSHNYFSFNPTAGNLNIAGQQFQWSDGIFSITLKEPSSGTCSVAYFHPLISTQEFSVSTCVLRNSTASSDRNYYQLYSVVGDRGISSQSTMHGYHPGSGVIFFADIGRDAVSCWRMSTAMTPSNVHVLASDTQKMSYPSDLHVTDDEVWVMANTLPRFGYSRFDTDQYNFYVYRGSVRDLIAGTICDNRQTYG